MKSIPSFEKRTFTVGAHEKPHEITTLRVGRLEDIFQQHNIPIPGGAQSIVDALHSSEVTVHKNGTPITRRAHALIAGGFVRDLLLHHTPHDLNFTTNLPAHRVVEILQDMPHICKIGTHGKSSEVVRVTFDSSEEYEISFFKTASDDDTARHTCARP